MSTPRFYIKANTYSNINPYPSWKRDADYWEKDVSNNLFYMSGNVGIGYPNPKAKLLVDGTVGIGTSLPQASLDVSGNTTISGNFSANNMVMFRNRIINGCMRVDQRNNGLSNGTTGLLTNNSGYGLDRWKNVNNSYINVSQQQVSLSGSDVVAIGGNLTNAVSLTTTLNSYNGLVSHYPFDGTTNDVYRNLPPTVTGTITYNSPGKVGTYSAFFNNSTAAAPTNYIVTTNPTPQVPLTFAFWINPNTQPQLNTIMSFNNGTFTASNLNMNVDITTGNVINTYIALPSLWSISALSSGALTTGAWSHICITMSSTWVCTMHVNGVAVATQTGTGNFPTAYASTLSISRQGDGTSRGFYGYLDDLRFYNRALSAPEVYLLYQSSTTNYTPIFRIPSSPIIYYPFEGNTNDSVSGYNLTTVGSVSYVTGYVSPQAMYLANETDVINASVATNYLTSSYNCPTTFTVSFWFCPTRLKTSGNTMFSTNSATTNVTNTIGIYIQSNVLYMAFNNTANNATGISIYPHQWYHVALTYNNGTMILYGNGAKSGNTLTGTYVVNGFMIGYSRDNSNLFPFAGYIDDFRIYSSVLTPNQVSEMYMSYTPYQHVLFQQPIEGSHIYDLGLGTSIASPMNVSCWIKNNTAYSQTFSLSVNNNGLIGYMPFNNSYVDVVNTWLSQPNRYGNVTFSNSVVKTGSHSVYFNNSTSTSQGTGTTQCLTYTVPANIQPQTVSFWFNCPSYSNNQTLFAFISTISSLVGYNFYIIGSTIISAPIYFTNSTTVGVSASVNLVVNTWYHIAITYTPGGTYKMFFNGSLVGTNIGVPLNTSLGTSTYGAINALQIGGFTTTNGFTFNGYIDDFRIYNRPLTASQIYQLYQSTTTDYLLARSYVYNTPVITPGTWRKISFTVPSETIGAWFTDNNTGLLLSVCLGASPEYATPTNVWNSVTEFTGTGVQYMNDVSTNFLGINGNNIWITGVQLERGNIITPYEYRPLSMELQLCQRYYEIVFDNALGDFTESLSYWSVASTAPHMANRYMLRQIKRSIPSVILGSVTGRSCTAILVTSVNEIDVYISSLTGATWFAYYLYLPLTVSAEL